MGWNAEEKASYFLNALEDMKAMLKDFDNAEDWDHAKTTARCLAWLSGNENWFEISHEYWKKQQQKELKEDIAKKERETNNFKRYADELERRKREAPSGVPLESSLFAGILGTYYFGFTSNKEKKVFDGLLKDYVEALQKLAKGEPIDIRALLPLLRKGWVAMDKDGRWHWYSEKPHIEKFYFCWKTDSPAAYIGGLNLNTAEDWETSLMECGL